jgi:hypothetical protein
MCSQCGERYPFLQLGIRVVLLKIQQEEPTRLRACHPGLDRDVEAVVHRCPEKAPARRYQTARELADDLRRYLDGEPVQARPVSWLDRKLKWVRRHPKEAAAYGLALLVALLLVIGSGFGWLWRQADAERERARSAEVGPRGACMVGLRVTTPPQTYRTSSARSQRRVQVFVVRSCSLVGRPGYAWA